MRKVLLACDGPHFSDKAFEFIRHMNEEEKVLATGVFLATAESPALWNYASGATGPLMLPVEEDSDHTNVSSSVRHFEELCRKNDIEYRIHTDNNEFAIKELKEESRFADLMVIGTSCFYANRKEHPNSYLMDVLHESECPVLAVPESYTYPGKIVLTYDGSASSVHAIKQFIYLFPEWKDKPAILVFAGNQEKIPYQVSMEELASRHFNDLAIQQLPIDAVKYLTVWLENERDAIIVTGSSGRSRWTPLWGRKDFLSELLEDQHEHYLYEQKLEGNCLPVFIAHR